jgi:NAD+ kinase
MANKFNKIGIVSSTKNKKAEELKQLLKKKYKLIDVKDKLKKNINPEVDAIVALGGDGFMLHTLHSVITHNIPIFGMNCGTVGFLMNETESNNLLERLDDAKTTKIPTLKMKALASNGTEYKATAINEVFLYRSNARASYLKIEVDGVVKIPEMICDGALVATPAGSSAYNLSVGGTILPLNTDLLALTPISPFRPRRWRGALLPNDAIIKFTVLDTEKRPVNAVADFNQFNNIKEVEIRIDKSNHLKILFDPGHSLEERILREQFIQ